MSLEQKIDNLVNVIEKLVNVIEAKSVPTVLAQPEKLSAKPAEVPVVVEAPAPVVVAQPAPVVVPETVAAPVAAPSMPPLPDFAAPAPATLRPSAPFSDPKGMIQYVTEAWKALGAKGPKMQEVIVGLGHHNINEIRPDQYGALYAGIEALKHGA